MKRIGLWKTKGTKWKQMLITLLITGVIAFISLVLYYNVLQQEEKRCWQVLEDATKSIQDEVTMKFYDEVVKLYMPAEMMKTEDMLEEEKIETLHLEIFQPTTIFSRIDVFYPDNTVVTDNGTRTVLQQKVDFAEVAKRGEHISARQIDDALQTECVYYIMPIKKEEETVAILVGVIEAKNLSSVFAPDIYNGRANCCIVDSQDGNYIMDNWHTELGNAFETPNRKRLKGYEDVDLKNEIKNLETGVLAFVSQTTGKGLYMYYTPLDMFDWELLIFIQEDVLFENLYQIKCSLLLAGCLEFALLILYFVWNIRTINQLEKSKEEVEQQLENSNTLIQCATELSSDKDISVSRKNLLKIINRYFQADGSYIFEVDTESEVLVNTHEYVTSETTTQSLAVQKILVEKLTEWMKAYKRLQNGDIQASKDLEIADFIRLNQPEIGYCMAVPLCRDSMLIGFIGIGNLKKHYDDTKLLESLQFFITSSLFKQRHQEQLRYMSYQDMLTQLYNRNKYMQVLSVYEEQRLENMGVLYVDLNGLKQINDTQSHGAGDCYIYNAAKIISESFPEKAYRIGGDEFVVLSRNMPKEEFWKKTEIVRERMKEEKVSVSMGCVWQESCCNLDAMLKEAEREMYQEKEEYYKTHDRRDKRLSCNL